MEINIKNSIGKVEIHCNEPKEILGLENVISEILGKVVSGAVADISQVPSEEKEIPCKDENLCEKMKFNQQVEDIISSNREKSFQQCEALFSEFQKKETSDNLKTFQNYALIILPVKP